MKFILMLLMLGLIGCGFPKASDGCKQGVQMGMNMMASCHMCAPECVPAVLPVFQCDSYGMKDDNSFYARSNAQAMVLAAFTPLYNECVKCAGSKWNICYPPEE